MDNDERNQELRDEVPTRRQFFSALVGSGGEASGNEESGRREFMSSVGKLLVGLAALLFGWGLFGTTQEAGAQWYWWVDPWGRRRRRRRGRGRRGRRRGRGRRGRGRRRRGRRRRQ